MHYSGSGSGRISHLLSGTILFWLDSKKMLSGASLVYSHLVRLVTAVTSIMKWNRLDIMTVKVLYHP